VHLVTRFLRAPAIDVTDGDDLDIGPPEKARQIGVEDLTPRADEAEVDATAGGTAAPAPKMRLEMPTLAAKAVAELRRRKDRRVSR
jgi:hypothetical protein